MVLSKSCYPLCSLEPRVLWYSQQIEGSEESTNGHSQYAHKDRAPADDPWYEAMNDDQPNG
jgi:hypothetical protein